MARKKDTPCAGKCGRLLYRGTGSLPNPTCRDCRRKRRLSYCPKCGTQIDTRYAYCSRLCANRMRGRKRIRIA
jgi:hypothetical protein